MIGVGVAFIVVGVFFLLIVPWIGIVVGCVGLFLALLWVAGVGRRAVAGDSGIEHNRV